MREKEMEEDGAEESWRELEEVEGRIHFLHHLAQTTLKALSRPRNCKRKRGREGGERTLVSWLKGREGKGRDVLCCVVLGNKRERKKEKERGRARNGPRCS